MAVPEKRTRAATDTGLGGHALSPAMFQIPFRGCGKGETVPNFEDCAKADDRFITPSPLLFCAGAIVTVGASSPDLSFCSCCLQREQSLTRYQAPRCSGRRLCDPQPRISRGRGPSRTQRVLVVCGAAGASVLRSELRAQQRAGKSEARTADISRHRRLTRAPTLRLETCARRR
jgi:hypothetical protein